MLRKLILSILGLIIFLLPACSVPEQESYNTDLAYKMAYYQGLLGGTSVNVTITGFSLNITDVDTATPIAVIVDGLREEGTSTSFVRADHKHNITGIAIRDVSELSKLDDFAIPDDNTDLDATSGRHGLLPKLSDNSSNFLDGTGNWSAPSGGATKEVFFPTFTFLSGAAITGHGKHGGIRIDAVGEKANTEFYIPQDFISLDEAVLLVIPIATQASGNYDISSEYAGNGENYQTHTGSDTATTYNVTVNVLYEIDLSGIITSLSVGDYVGVQFAIGTAGHGVTVVGIRFKYN